MEFRSQPCIFLGYSSSHLGYLCFEPHTQRIYQDRYVRFEEHQFPFATNTSGPQTLLSSTKRVPSSSATPSLMPWAAVPHFSSSSSTPSTIPHVRHSAGTTTPSATSSPPVLPPVRQSPAAETPSATSADTSPQLVVSTSATSTSSSTSTPLKTRPLTDIYSHIHVPTLSPTHDASLRTSSPGLSSLLPPHQSTNPPDPTPASPPNTQPPAHKHKMTLRSRKQALTASIFHSEPTSFVAANNSPVWRKAMQEEIHVLHKNNTWVLVP